MSISSIMSFFFLISSLFLFVHLLGVSYWLQIAFFLSHYFQKLNSTFNGQSEVEKLEGELQSYKSHKKRLTQ